MKENDIIIHFNKGDKARLTEDLVDQATGMRLLPANSVVTITCNGPINVRFFTIEEVDGIMVSGKNLSTVWVWPCEKQGDTVFLLPIPKTYHNPYSWGAETLTKYEISGITCSKKCSNINCYDQIQYNLLSESGQEIPVWTTDISRYDYRLVKWDGCGLFPGYACGVPVTVKNPIPLKVKVHKV